MEDTITIPVKPWTDADVAFLIHNADFLPQEVKDELGLTPAVADDNFKADYDAAREIEPPVIEEETIVVTQEILDENPVLAEAGVQVGDIGVATDEVPEGAMIEEVVNNEATDNA